MERVGDLEVEQDLEHSKRGWTVQRVGWIVMLLVAIAGLLGAFGRGALSQAVVGAAEDPIRFEYNRITRHGAPEKLEIHLAPGVAKEGKAQIWITREYIQRMKVEDIQPEPESVDAGGDRVLYTFNAADASQPITVAFHLQTDGYGQQEARIGLEGGATLSFRQFVLP